MSTLLETIEKASIVHVNIDTSTVVKIFQKMNQTMKDMEERIHNLENTQHIYVTIEMLKRETNPLSMRITELSNNIEKSLEDTKLISNKMQKSQENIEETLNNKCNEVLIASKVNTKQTYDDLMASINQIKISIDKSKEKLLDEFETTKNNINEESAELNMYVQTLSDRIKHVHSEFIKHCSNCTNESSHIFETNDLSTDRNDIQPIISRIDKLTKAQNELRINISKSDQKINQFYDQIMKAVNEKLVKLHDSIRTILLSQEKPQTDSTRIQEIWAALIQNKNTLLNSISNHEVLSKKVDDICAKIGLSESTIPIHQIEDEKVEEDEQNLIHQLINEINTQQKSQEGDVTLKEQNHLFSTVDGLGDKVSIVSQDIQKIKNAVNKNEKNVRDVVLAIIDEFKLIHGNATGLENLPPLNLAQCVPSFFNNPSFTFTRNDESGQSSANEYDSVSRSVSYDQIQEVSEPSRTLKSPILEEKYERQTKAVSGLLRLVCCPQYNAKREPNVKLSDKNSISSNSESDFSFDFEMTKEINNNMQDHKIPSEKTKRKVKLCSSENIREIVKKFEDDNIKDFKSMMHEFKTEKDELMTAVDRKVDRDMVERLFNKFRVIVQNLNDKINEMASKMQEFATQDEINTVAKAIIINPIINDNSNRSLQPEVIKCSHAKSRMYQSYPNTAASMQGVHGSNKGETVVCTESMTGSIPKFHLPPLKEIKSKLIPC